jgi:hypothetical protein
LSIWLWLVAVQEEGITPVVVVQEGLGRVQDWPFLLLVGMVTVITQSRLGLVAPLILHLLARQEAMEITPFFLPLHLSLAVVGRLLTGTVEAAALEVVQGVKTQVVQLLVGQPPHPLLDKVMQAAMVDL